MAVIDWNAVLTAIRNGELDSSDYSTQIADAIRDRENSRNATEIIELVTTTILEDPDLTDDPDNPPVAVTFESSQWDNGWFLRPTPTVHFANGDTHEFTYVFEPTTDAERARRSMERELDDLFGEYVGACGENTVLGVNLRTGDIDLDDCSTENVLHALGVLPVANTASES